MIWKKLLSLCLLIVMPTLAVESSHLGDAEVLKHAVKKVNKSPWKNSNYTYDDLLNFFEELESGALEERCSEDDLEQINHFMVKVGECGILPDSEDEAVELHKDSNDLLNSDHLAFEYDTDWDDVYRLEPAVFSDFKVHAQKVGLRKAWKKTKKWCKKHKKALIIGAVVVVTVAIVVTVAVVASSGAGAAAVSTATKTAAGGAAGGAAAGSGSAVGAGAGVGGAVAAIGSAVDSKKKKEAPRTRNTGRGRQGRGGGEISIPPEPPKVKVEEKIEQAPRLMSILDDQCKVFKESLKQDFSVMRSEGGSVDSIKDMGRVYGSMAAHDSYNEVAIGSKSERGLCDEIKGISVHSHSEGAQVNGLTASSMAERLEKNAPMAHKRIDSAFATNFTDKYVSQENHSEVRRATWEDYKGAAFSDGVDRGERCQAEKACVVAPLVAEGLAAAGAGTAVSAAAAAAGSAVNHAMNNFGKYREEEVPELGIQEFEKKPSMPNNVLISPKVYEKDAGLGIYSEGNRLEKQGGPQGDRILQPLEEYFEGYPDRKLPQKYGGEPLPDTDVPHTQLGTREGSKTGAYRQAREFNEIGKPVRDIDFTDHGLPDIHPSPHQHQWLENETGGTKKRDKQAKPLEESPSEKTNE